MSESEAGGSCFVVDKDSTPSQDTDGSFSRKKKKRRASPAQRRHKTSRHRRGQTTDTAASRRSNSSNSSHTSATTASTDVGDVPSLPASEPSGGTGQGPTVRPPENEASLGAPLTSQRDIHVEAAEQHAGVEGAVVPSVGPLPEKCEPSTTTDLGVTESAQRGTVVANAGASASHSIVFQSSRALAEASAGGHSEHTPNNFRGDGESQAGLPGTSAAPHQLQPSRGSDALAAENEAKASALPGPETNHTVIARPPRDANDEDVTDVVVIELENEKPAPEGAAAIGGATETHVAVTLGAGTVPFVVSPYQAQLAAGIPGPSSDVSSADKLAPRGDPLANKPPSPSELKRRARLLQHSFAEMVASGTSAGRQQLLVVAAVSATASLLFLVVSALVLVLLMRASSADGDAGGSDPCGGLSDCYQHMALIASRVNRSIDPCQDFSAHVCSAWSAPEFREFASTQDDVALSWARQFRDILDAGTKSLPTGLKAIAFYRKCMENSSHENIAIATRQLRQFMADRGIPWPERPTSPSVTPLGVLFDLAINWQLPLWFSVHLSPLPGSQTRAVVLTPSVLILSWEKYHREILGKGAFVTYYTAFVDALEPAENAIVHRDAEFIRKVARLEGTVLQELANAEKSRVPPPGSWQFPLSEATRHTPSIPAEQWLYEANKNFDVTPAVTNADVLTTSNGVFLKAVDSVFGHYGQSELLAYLAWFLVQVLAPAVDPGLLVVRYGSEERASAHRPLFCATHVETVFRMLIISLYAIPRFSATMRNNVDALLRGIRHTAAERVDALPWLDEASKIHGRFKLERMNTTLWPAPDFLEESGLDHAYRNFGWSNGSTFFEAWVQNHRALRQVVRAGNFNVSMPANLALPLMEYNYLRNSVRVSVQSLSRPVFYGHGTLAMFYGGLGFLYTREMVKALDSEGSRRDYLGVLEKEPWMSLTWRESLMDPEACLEGTSAGGYFPEIPALEISYASLESAFDASETSASERIAERRLFFLTLCYFLCSRAGVEQHPVAGGDCNKAVANFAPFAETFSCPLGAGMRPKKRCSFFDS
ncbi:hypothetical protein HPB52_001774 [Rhipicephalus sanguineus]|uniref:Peptidase M13 N-terminal domain-containing protein n=1 Tax=Rhipicephalus sanguineus TaxID=34632 RepID=A0A9D4T6N9_RHISA|nr:hypothetical protein HPB52_001774 [Rhipicephalus sanguineus]